MRTYLLQAFVQYDDTTNTGNAAGNVKFDVIYARGASAGQPADVFIDAAGSATVPRVDGKFTTNQFGIFENQNGGSTYFENGYYSFIFDDSDINSTNKLIDIPIFAVEQANETTVGLTRYSTQSEAESGASDNSAMTPLKSIQQANKRLSESLIYKFGVGSICSKQNLDLEGGELRFEKADNSTLASDVSLDVNAESVRIFEDGGNARGVFVDIKECGAGATSYIHHSGIKVKSSTLEAYTVATLPSAAANPYTQIFVTDLSGQAAPCYSDGVNWRRYSDNTIAS